MGNVLLKKERWLPPSVLGAKARGDIAELSRLGLRGNEVKKARNQWRDQQGVLPLKAKRQKSSAACQPRKPLTPEQKASQAETRYLNQLRRNELAAIALADAEQHALSNRIGWDEEE